MERALGRVWRAAHRETTDPLGLICTSGSNTDVQTQCHENSLPRRAACNAQLEDISAHCRAIPHLWLRCAGAASWCTCAPARLRWFWKDGGKACPRPCSQAVRSAPRHGSKSCFRKAPSAPHLSVVWAAPGCAWGKVLVMVKRSAVGWRSPRRFWFANSSASCWFCCCRTASCPGRVRGRYGVEVKESCERDACPGRSKIAGSSCSGIPAAMCTPIRLSAADPGS
jgi:hypothetical protein